MFLDSVTFSSTVRPNQLLLQSGAFGPVKKVNSNNPAEVVTAAGPDPRLIKSSLNVFNINVSTISGAQALQGDPMMDVWQTLVDGVRMDLKFAMVEATLEPQMKTGFSQKASLTLDGPTGADAAGALGTATDLTNAGSGTANSLDGKTIVLKTSATATNTITLGTAAGQVNSIDALNSALSKDGVQLTASFDATTGKIALTSTDDAASQTITKTGTYAAPRAVAPLTVSYDAMNRPFVNSLNFGSSSSVDISGTIGATAAVTAPVGDPAPQGGRAALVLEYNHMLAAIPELAKATNLRLNGESLKLESDQIGSSSVTSVTSVTFKDAPLDAKAFGLSELSPGNDLLDNVSITKAIAALDRFTGMLSSLDPASSAAPESRVKLYGGLATPDLQEVSSAIEKSSALETWFSLNRGMRFSPIFE
jgi:hypothetical protein